MPQENYPITVTTTDSVYTINSADEVIYLPDSVQKIIEDFNGSGKNAYAQEKPIYTTPPYEVSPEFVIGALILFIIIILKAREALRQIEEERQATETAEGNESYTPPCLVYKGAELAFSSTTIHTICAKYNPFYNKLNAEGQDKFTGRVSQFIKGKNFYIMSSNGYKEMPVLIAAAAIQISFGLEDFLLPHFSRIIIHPEEYIAYDPLRILVGNVQGKAISISWKHFLDDYLDPSDGRNVGLHEMAHALQVEHIFQNNGFENDFKRDYENYDRIDDELLLAARQSGTTFFDENALSNSNELWATGVELFFEQPNNLQAQYPQLYHCISTVLNQDTAAS